MDGNIEYGAVGNGTTYNKRTYIFDGDTINSTRQDILLYLLAADESTSFIQSVVDNQIPVQNAVIKTYRWFPGTNTWTVTQITTTDSKGKTIGFYKTETVDYKHEIFLDGILRLNESSGRKIYAESTPFTITFEIGEPADDFKDMIVDKDQLSSTLEFNADTLIVSYTYADDNSTFQQGRLFVVNEKYNVNDNQICNETSLVSSRILTCNLTGLTGTFIAQGFNKRAGVESLDKQERFSIADDTLGTTGIFIGVIIIFTASLVFLGNKVAGIIAVDVAVIACKILTLINFSSATIWAIIVISLIAMWAVRDK